MTETTERPLVTFAIVAYNQERFIREAVEGAFAQTYQPLEIILSDDCSPDRTFEIMQEMAAAYDGPHRVRVMRNPENMGITPHVLARGREAAGEVVVVAAGDDISAPDRVARHVAHYRDPEVWAVTGGYDLIDDRGRLLSTNETEPEIIARGFTYRGYMRTPIEIIQGSTASYRRSVFHLPLPATEILISEDNLFTFLIPANGGRIVRDPMPLVRYRRHDGAVANRLTRLPPIELEHRINLACREGRNRLQLFLGIAGTCLRPEAVDRDALLAQLRLSADLVEWPSFPFRRRLASALRSLMAGDLRNARWKIVRIAGRFPHYQPRIFLIRVLDRLRGPA